jgi:hypothetical protein
LLAYIVAFIVVGEHIFTRRVDFVSVVLVDLTSLDHSLSQHHVNELQYSTELHGFSKLVPKMKIIVPELFYHFANSISI